MTKPLTGPEARRAEMVDRINAAGAIRVDQLADLFQVSAMTVHRDLEALDASGQVERVRGGARAVSGQLTERDVAQRRTLNVTAKQRLAEATAELIGEGEVIALDDSTTVEALGPLLVDKAPSAVITHSLGLITYFAHQAPQVPLIGLGGRYVAGTDSFLGQATARQTEELSADVSVVSTTSVRGGGLYHPDEDAALTKAACVRLGRRRILVADASKFGAAGLYFVTGLDAFDDVVVEDDLTDRAAEMLAASGARIHRIPVPTGPDRP